MPTDIPAPVGQRRVTQVREAIRGRIVAGDYQPGERLPSEARLTQDFGVSRTVIREAVAALQSERLLEARQGAGVFVLKASTGDDVPFRNLDLAKVSSLIEMLELRTAVEGDAAGLAAIRRSAAQEEAIIECFDSLRDLSRAGKPTVEADFGFHMAIAQASNNPRFPEFLRLIGTAIIPRHEVNADGNSDRPDYLQTLDQEHELILSAILVGDEHAARAAMREHLKSSQTRYRQYLRMARR